MAQAALSHARLLEVLTYNKETGSFTWRVQIGRRVKVGSLAGKCAHGRYCTIQIDGYRYRAHRLAWFYVHGEWPKDQLDHRSRVRTDNRLSDLRPVTNSQNQMNVGLRRDNTSGVKGVHWNNQFKRWRAVITKDRHVFSLGLFKAFHEAVSARQQAEQKLFGAFAGDALRAKEIGQ
jgi:hypothetical protein